MIKIYGLNPLYQGAIYMVSSKILKPANIYRSIDYFLYNPYRGRSASFFVPVPADKRDYIEYTNSLYASKMSIEIPTTEGLKEGVKLYVHPDCGIARTHVAKKYKQVRKPEKADYCVIPSLKQGRFSVYKYAIFVNMSKGKTYLIREEKVRKNDAVVWEPLFSKSYPVGTPLKNINLSLESTPTRESSHGAWGEPEDIYSSQNWQDLLNSTLGYYGYCVYLEGRQSYIGDFMYNKLHHIVTEDDVMHTLGDEESKMTIDTYQAIKEMLLSTDDEIVGMGLKTLAEMDYSAFPNTAIHLLYDTKLRWRGHTARYNTTVKFMLNSLGIWDNVREKYKEDINQEDFDLMLTTIQKDVKEQIDSSLEAFKYRFPFAEINIDYNVSINPKLKENGKENSEELN